jgi:hypothetical protein
MSWTGKIKNAFEGVVDGSDARARLASGAPLASLRQQLSDRRLDVEIANLDEPWRAPFALSTVAAPLWVAESLLSLAESLSDAEVTAHPDRPTAMAALTHDQILALLEPIAMLQGEISGAIADPNRRSALSLPLLVRPYATTTAGLMAERVPVPYLRGLLAGVSSLSGAAQLLVEDYTPFMSHPSAPAWLRRGLATLKGDLAAAQARLDAAQAESVPVLRQPTPDEAALRTLAVDLWQVANTYLKLGQQITAPSLLPGAQPLPLRASELPSPAGVSTTTLGSAGTAGATPESSPPAGGGTSPNARPAPLPGPETKAAPEKPRAMPEIGGHGAPKAIDGAPAQVPTPAQPRTMPEIGGRGAPAPAGRAEGSAPAPDRPRAMPAIGGQSTPVPADRTETQTPRATNLDQPRTMPEIGSHSTVDTSNAPSVAETASHRPEVSSAAPAATQAPPARSGAQAPSAVSRRVDRAERWMLSARTTRHRLRAAGQEDQAERELAAFWEAKNWSLTATEAQYVDQVAALLSRGAISLSGRSRAECPFAPIYRVTDDAQVLGRPLRPGTLVSYEFREKGHGLLVDLPASAGVPDGP